MYNGEREDNEDVEMVTTRSTPPNWEALNQQPPNQTIFNNDEVHADYPRREERMTAGVVRAETYPAPYEYDSVDPLSNVAMFAWARCSDTVALDQDDSCDRYTTNRPLPGDVPLRALQ